METRLSTQLADLAQWTVSYNKYTNYLSDCKKNIFLQVGANKPKNKWEKQQSVLASAVTPVRRRLKQKEYTEIKVGLG